MMAAQFREVVGDGWLEPVHPIPPAALRNDLILALRARKNLLVNWREDDYAAAVTDFRIFGRQMVIVNTPAGVKHVLATHNDNYERKSPQMRRALDFLLGDGLLISDGEIWSTRRPLVSEMVGKSRVPAFGPQIVATAQEMIQTWRDVEPAKPLNIHAEMGVLTAEIISRTLFGVHLGRTRAEQVVSSFTQYQGDVESFNIGYLLGFDEGLPVWKGPSLRRAKRRIQAVVDYVIQEHLKGCGDQALTPDKLATCPRSGPQTPAGRDALCHEATTLFLAGHESAASILSWSWHLLSKAPWAERAVHAEIKAVCASRTPAYDDLPRLVYCRAVIEETLRLYPPVAILARQASQADRIEDIYVEPGALAIVSPWLLHRSPDLWPHANRFMPERFLGNVRPAPYAYVPFAAGPRICPGLAFGMAENVLCLAIIAQSYRLRPAPGVTVEPECRLTLRPKRGLPMLIEPR